ncbi:MAG: hypothetical protein J6U54_18070 [Clostridiales bacterium]|nr:hypothetical protein [Clostridiales bacterium]
MTLLYFKQRIDDELEGAKEYIQDAISLKETHPAWAKVFAEMSDVELGHAKKLLDMFNAYYAEKFPNDGKNGPTDTMEEVREDFMAGYTKCYTDVLRMHELYKK